MKTKFHRPFFFKICFNCIWILTLNKKNSYVIYFRNENINKYFKMRTSRKTYCKIKWSDSFAWSLKLTMNSIHERQNFTFVYAYSSFKFNDNFHSTFSKTWTRKKKFTLTISLAIDIFLISQNLNFSFNVRQFIQILIQEISFEFAAIVFVKIRAFVKLLFVLLTIHFVTKNIFRIETFVDTSNHHARVLNINDFINISEQKKTLNDLRNKNKNFIIATNVCKKDINIVFRNVVICFESSSNLKFFVQKKTST